MGAVAQRAEPGDVVGMQVRVDRLDQLEVELADELEIAVDLLQHRIDDQRLAAAPAGEQIGVGAGNAVESWRKIIAEFPPGEISISPGAKLRRSVLHNRRIRTRAPFGP